MSNSSLKYTEILAPVGDDVDEETLAQRGIRRGKILALYVFDSYFIVAAVYV